MVLSVTRDAPFAVVISAGSSDSSREGGGSTMVGCVLRTLVRIGVSRRGVLAAVGVWLGLEDDLDGMGSGTRVCECTGDGTARCSADSVDRGSPRGSSSKSESELRGGVVGLVMRYDPAAIMYGNRNDHQRW